MIISITHELSVFDYGSPSLLLLLLLSRVSHVWLCVTPQRAAHQAPLSRGFSRQEYWSGLPFPSPVPEREKWKWSRSVVSDSSQPHGLQPTRLLCPWDFPGKSTGVRCHCLLRSLQRCFSNLSLHRNHLENCWTTDHWDLCPRRGRGAENLHF